MRISFKVLALLFFTEITSASSIRVLNDCNEELDLRTVYTVLNGERNTLDGWNHVQKAKPDHEYSSLRLDDTAYDISNAHHKADQSCDGALVQDAILVLKLSDWTRQHSNGIETILDSNTVLFGDVSHVMLDIRVNTKGTYILNDQQLRERYGEYLSDEQFAQFDQGKVNLGITLFEDGSLDQSSESFNLEYFLEIDQDIYADQWLRVLMPLTAFNAYTEKEYQATAQDFNDYNKVSIKGFRINPENSHGKQLRNLLGDAWSEDIPETFKEASISLRRIEFLSID